jgi:hypothetical protein
MQRRQELGEKGSEKKKEDRVEGCMIIMESFRPSRKIVDVSASKRQGTVVGHS